MPAETASPRPGEELDAAAVADYLASVLPELTGEVSITQFPGGASNLTYLVEIGGDQLVLRRPPFGTKARSAHDMGREYRILSRLRPVFPYCPRPLAFCEDPDVLGEPFYVMERLEGTVLRRELPGGLQLSPEQGRALCTELLDVHMHLHSVDYESAGLSDMGRPDGYVQRQVLGWSRRYRDARTADVPENESLMDWLEASMPAEAAGGCIIHNDYKFDNVVLERTDEGLRISGVLDWEMATLGDPLMDLGCSLAYWIQADDPPEMMAARMMPTHLPGMMSRREIVDYYLSRSGLEVGSFDFYYVFGLFRLAVIVQQIYYRYFHGQTADQRFEGFGRLGALLSGRAEAVIAGDATL
jgi:aminoglycoside phosphotransferase (APT) family kinase protein